jgi:solute carrier family 35 protein F1/2
MRKRDELFEFGIGLRLPLALRVFGVTGSTIALLIAGTGVSSSFLVEWGVSVPTTQSALNYALLSVTYLGYRAATRGWRSLTRLRLAWWRYALLGTLDVEANFLIVLAYRYTSITSVMLIDAWTIPCVMALSWWFLGARFQVCRYVGVVLRLF